MILNISKVVTTFFGIGYFPIASGTVGSLAAVFLWYIILSFFSYKVFIFYFIIIVFLGFICTNIYLKSSESKDPSEVIIDEVIGQSIPLLFISLDTNIVLIILTFFIFRFFDIFKIFPIDKSEDLPGEYGVIIDDIIAGIYTLFVIFCLININNYFN